MLAEAFDEQTAPFGMVAVHAAEVAEGGEQPVLVADDRARCVLGEVEVGAAPPA